MSKVSPSTDSRSINVCRFSFDAAMSTDESNDSISALWRVTGWRCSVGGDPVSHFIFLCWIDLYSFELDMATSTAGPMDHTAMFRRIPGWLHDAHASQVSRFAFLCLFVIDMLDLDLYRLDLDVIASTPGSNNPI